ncbi:hypothetical protein Q7P37_007398 [Cladosporium fusiforme]
MRRLRDPEQHHIHSSRPCGSATPLMKCRPKLCQRLAAQLKNTPPAPPANGNIWITDEVLADAFNRYVRVSHASRRFGSHVPGPLEARRRASKRRMGCAVVGASMAPPGGDFGALFGVGGADVSEKGWSWKPPGSQLDQPSPEKKPSKMWSWNEKPSKPPPEWEQLLEMPQSEEDLVEASREAFEDLLYCHRHEKELGFADVNPILDFLCGPENEPKANNTIRMVKWLAKPRYASSEAWQAITNVICDKIQLATIGEEELIEVIRTLHMAQTWEHHRNACHKLHESFFSFWKSLDGKGSSEDPIHQAIMISFAQTIRDKQSCVGLIDLISKAAASADTGKLLSKNIFATLQAISDFQDEGNADLLSQLALSLDKIPTTIRTEALADSTSHIISLRESNKSVKRRLAQLWLACLESTASFSHCSDTMDAVYRTLAALFNVSDLAAHFKALESKAIVDIMLRVWLPVAKMRAPEEMGGPASSSFRKAKTLQPALKDPSVACLPIISSIYWAYNISEDSRCAWEDLVRAHSQVRVRYDYVASEVLAISRAINTPSDNHAIYHRLIQSPHLVIPTSAGIATVKYFLDEQLPRYALAAFQATPSIAITDVPNLPLLSMIKHGRFQTSSIMALLLRQPEKIPMEQRPNLSLALHQEHIDVVHMIAHDTAHTSSIDAKPAYRHVWAYYRFLRDRNAPLQALMARAMVQAGILRHIQERLWIPDERLDYILSVVEQIEGTEVRDQVKDIAVHLRASVHDEVLAKRKIIEERAVWHVARESGEKRSLQIEEVDQEQPYAIGLQAWPDSGELGEALASDRRPSIFLRDLEKKMKPARGKRATTWLSACVDRSPLDTSQTLFFFSLLRHRADPAQTLACLAVSAPPPATRSLASTSPRAVCRHQALTTLSPPPMHGPADKGGVSLTLLARVFARRSRRPMAPPSSSPSKRSGAAGKGE